jgi:hypothetical protein
MRYLVLSICFFKGVFMACSLATGWLRIFLHFSVLFLVALLTAFLLSFFLSYRGKTYLFVHVR